MLLKKYTTLKFLIVFGFLGYSDAVIAQSESGLHPKTLQFANEVYLECPMYVNEELLNLYDKQVRRIEIVQWINGSLNDVKLLSSVALKNKCNPSLTYEGANFDGQNFNPLKYFFNYSASEDQFIRIDNTNFVIQIKP